MPGRTVLTVTNIRTGGTLADFHAVRSIRGVMGSVPFAHVMSFKADSESPVGRDAANEAENRAATRSCASDASVTLPSA